MEKKIRVGVSGDVGSFSEQAARTYVQKTNANVVFRYLIDMEHVLAALSRDNIDIGIFPVMNMGSGLVQPAFAAMGKYEFSLVDEIWLEVRQCLLALPETPRSHIDQIVSYPQALAQCSHYLHKEFAHVAQVAWSDTAKAAKDLANGSLKHTSAVIASAHAAQCYNLAILDENIQNQDPNLTAFVVVQSPHALLSKHQPQTLSQLRQAIKKIDALIIDHLAQRQRLSQKVGQLKALAGRPIIDHEREQTLMSFYQRLSKKYGLESTYIQHIFKIIIKYSRKMQKHS